MDGNTWMAYDNNKPVSKGTWVSSVTPDAGAEGTITFTVTEIDTGKGWIYLSEDQKKSGTAKVKYSIDPEGNQITLSEKKLAAADPAGIWNKLEGVYKKGGPESGGNASAGSGNRNAGGSSSQSSRQSSTTRLNPDAPYISYTITGSGTSFTAKKNGVTVGTANQAITDVIDAIITDANGSNTAIQFGGGASALNIGGASARFNPNPGDSWGIIALSGEITSSASPTISVSSAFITSTADISSTSSGGSAIENSGTVIINSGTVSANAANSYGIRNKGGTVVINSGNVSPRGVGIFNDSGSSGRGGNVAINGGTVQSLSGKAIYNMNGCTVTIAGGTVSMINPNENYAAINNSNGCTATITGGNVLAPNGGKAVINAIDGRATVTSPPAVIVGSISGI